MENIFRPRKTLPDSADLPCRVRALLPGDRPLPLPLQPLRGLGVLSEVRLGAHEQEHQVEAGIMTGVEVAADLRHELEIRSKYFVLNSFICES